MKQFIKVRKLKWYEKFLIWLCSDPFDPDDFDSNCSKYCFEQYEKCKGGYRL